MEGLFRQIGIYNPKGQLYTPVDKDQVMYYREDKAGQILQEGINEAGGMSSWIAAATSYSTNNRVMIPFYVYYSMFGFQRIGDLAWAAGDMQARGFLLGGTSGRTTLNGEGLQHEDGHSHILAGTIPNCISYDPTFAHEVAVIMHNGLVRMVEKQENVYFYITLLNENYPMPGLTAGTEAEILKGMYLLQSAQAGGLEVNLLGSGTILRESIAAKEMLEADWGVGANVWSCPSFNELAREGQDAERWNLLHPLETPRQSFVAQQLSRTSGPVIASTDYMKSYADQIRAFVPAGRAYKVLGTDGFGRSDFRGKLREHFEVNRHYIVVATLKALAEEGKVAVGQGRRGDCQVRHCRRQDQPAVRLKREDKEMALVEVKVPDIGDFKDVAIIEVLVAVGDTIRVEQSLITVESDKASMEIPSSHAGVVKALRVKLGDTMNIGDVVLELETADAAAPAPAPAVVAAPAPVAAAPAPVAAAPAAGGGEVIVLVPDIGDFKDVAVIELLGQGGRHRCRRPEPDHRRERQGLDGDPEQPCRCGQGTQGPTR